MLKPARWAVTPGLVSPNWRWAWRDLCVLLPMWEGDGGMVDYAPGSDMLLRPRAGAAWAPTPEGFGAVCDESSGQHWAADPDTAGESVGRAKEPSTAITVMTVFRWDGTLPANWPGIIGQNYRPTAPYVSYQLSLPTLASEALPAFVVADNLTSNDWVRAGAIVADTTYIIIGWWPDANDYPHIEIYEIDGELFDSVTGGTSVANPLVYNTGSETGDANSFVVGVNSETNQVDGSVSFGAVWSRVLTPDEIRALVRDPFGMVRQAGTLILFPTLYTALTLTPNATGTVTAMWNELAETTNLHLSIDEWPETATDFITSGEGDGDAFIGMTATPSNFGLMKTLTIEGYARNSDFDTDSCNLYARVFKSDETTPLTDEVLLGNQTLDGLVEIDFTLNAAGLAANKGEWDGCVVKIREDYTA